MAAGLLVVGGIGMMVAQQASRPPAIGSASRAENTLALEVAPGHQAGVNDELMFNNSTDGPSLAEARQDAVLAGEKREAEAKDLLSSASADSVARSAGMSGSGGGAAALGKLQPGVPRWDIVNAYQLARRLDRKQTPEAQWDVNHDGVVDQRDVVLVAQAAVKLPPSDGGVGPVGGGGPGNPAGATGGGL